MINKFKKYLTIMTISGVLFSCTDKDNIPPITTPVIPSDKVWAYETTPVFEDNFSVNGSPDPTKWGYDIGGSGWGNNELQFYTNRQDNAVVSGGTLKIIAKKENYSGSAYTSARLLTKDKFSIKYGKIEVRAKMPTGIGTWPALWMLGSNYSSVGWPACGEIDIMEHLGRDLNKIYSSLHYPGYFGGNAVTKTLVIPTATSAFHNYIVEWTPNYIKFYVDTQLFHTFTNKNLLPFNQKFFMIMNMAMGGNFGGAVDPSFVSATMEVDYVKVYNIIP